MGIRELELNELEMLSYADIAYQILKEEQTTMSTADLFKIICKLRKFTKAQYEDKIADFFTLLTTDRRFFLLESGDWDLKEYHTAKIAITELQEEEILEQIEEEAEQEEIDEEIELLTDIDEDFEDENEDLGDLVVISDNDEEDEE
jgi:DNA-directed RNA polymerase subunit delta